MQHHLSTPIIPAVGGGSFSDDVVIDPEFEALVRENEQMLIEIAELRAFGNASQRKINDLEETCERLKEEKRSLQDLYDGSRRHHQGDEDDEDWQAKYEDLFEKYEDIVNSQVEENRAYEPHGSADSKERIDRILKELRSFHSSQQMSFGHLKRCGIIPSTLREKVSLECQKSLQMLTKLIETSRRLTTAATDDDEMIVLVKGLVGEATLAGALALQDTLTTFGEYLGISQPGSAASGGAAAGGGAQESGGASKMLNFWKGK
jgi:hypothetical protein